VKLSAQPQLLGFTLIYQVRTKLQAFLTPKVFILSNSIGLLNFWIALKDVRGRPLAFAKSSTVSQEIVHNRYHGSLDYDPKIKYTYIPDMKAGEIIVFYGSEVFHAAPEMEEFKGDRDALVIRWGFDRVRSGFGSIFERFAKL
jgi:hypothetical protein